MVINLNLAGREGFEPSKELLTPYPLSRRAHSTGLCDLPEFFRRRERDSNPR